MDQHRFHPRHLQTILFGDDCWFCSSLHVLTGCFRILLKHSKLMHNNDATDKMRNGLIGMDEVFASCDWARFAHFAQIFLRNFMFGFPCIIS